MFSALLCLLLGNKAERFYACCRREIPRPLDILLCFLITHLLLMMLAFSQLVSSNASSSSLLNLSHVGSSRKNLVSGSELQSSRVLSSTSMNHCGQFVCLVGRNDCSLTAAHQHSGQLSVSLFV